MAHDMGIPGYAEPNNYNYIAFAFWLTTGPADIALLWSDPITYFGTEFGSTKDQAQTFLKQKFVDAGVKLLVSAFGSTNNPTSENADPTQTAKDLADFVKNNKFDGVDIDYEDNAAMEGSGGVPWLVTFTTVLRAELPGYILTHAPQAPYFKTESYPHRGYVGIEEQIGSLIDFYNVQFYNQGDTSYDTEVKLFTQSGGYFAGTSVK